MEKLLKSCFNSPSLITQRFGVDFIWNHKSHPEWIGKKYYKEVCKIDGHNGIDVVPEDKNDLSIYNLISGIIVKLVHDDGYGNRLTIWNKDLQLLEYHNHMEFINPELKVDQIIGSRTFLGKMDSTGRSTGPHDHWAYRETDGNCSKIKNYNNGYHGYIDPLSVLAKL